MAKVIEVLKKACRQVYIQTKGLAGTEEGRKTYGKGAGGDVSTRMDLVAEKAVINLVKESGLYATIIGEECGRVELVSKTKTDRKGFLIMDGVDGTTNAIRGIPFYCCSLAYCTGYTLHSVTDAAIIDLVNGDLYHASKEKGAYRNGKKITVKHSTGDDMVIGMNISDAGQENINRLLPLILRTKHLRHFGANALELCHFASGLMDAYVDIRNKIRPTDMAGAYLIVKEAGGKLYSIDGSELDSDLGVKTRMSFLAVPDENVYRGLVSDLRL